MRFARPRWVGRLRRRQVPAGSTAVLPDGRRVVLPDGWGALSVEQLAEIGIGPDMVNPDTGIEIRCESGGGTFTAP